MKIKYEELQKVPKGDLFDPVVNSLARGVKDKIEERDRHRPFEFKFQRGVCQSINAYHHFNTVGEAIDKIEKQRLFGKLTVIDKEVVFAQTIVNDNVDFSKPKDKKKNGYDIDN